MPERHAGYVITFAEDISEEAAQAVIAKLLAMYGVIEVEPISSDIALQVATSRVRLETHISLINSLYGKEKAAAELEDAL